MSRAGWSIAGKRIEYRAGLPAGKLAIDGDARIKLKTRGEFPIEIGGQTYTFDRKRGLMGPRDTLRAPDGRLVPPSDKHVPLQRAEAGSRCAKHSETPATVVCPRCGSFACAACTGADATHCEACSARMVEVAERHARDLVLLTPAFIFVVTGGLLGALLGAGAGAAAVAIARRIDSTALKWVVAAGLYLLAGVIFVIVIGAMQSAAGE